MDATCCGSQVVRLNLLTFRKIACSKKNLRACYRVPLWDAIEHDLARLRPMTGQAGMIFLVEKS
jgi:hypothetical protein